MPHVAPHIEQDLLSRFDFFSYNHALEILQTAFVQEFQEVLSALKQFSLSTQDLLAAGGNESSIPPKFAQVLSPLGWEEIRITGDLLIHFYPRKGERSGVFSDVASDHKTIENYIDGHNIDYVKGRVALDVEWNSKDQTFDRDLFALRTYYECDIISVGIIITRSEKLDPFFKQLGIRSKYGASTTWMGKLLPRLDARRHGGGPVLAIGITPNCISDLEVEI